MPLIRTSIVIRAPIEAVFDLARSIDVHLNSQNSHNEKVIAGRYSGLIELNETVTWEATHLGVRQRLTSKIVEMHRPNSFRDSMVSGAFARFDHDHRFESLPGNITLMMDEFDYTSPWGILGKCADDLFLKEYMRKLLEHRNQTIRRLAEAASGQKNTNP